MNFCKKELAALALIGSAVPMCVAAYDVTPTYPDKPITLVIGFPPGGGVDALARLLAQYMAEELGQKVIINYRPGAASNIGAEAVARSTADGYTIYLGSRPNTIHKVMYEDIKYDFSRDLTPIGSIVTTPYVLVVGKKSPISTMEDLIARAKADPGALSCASVGVGTTPHLLCEMVQQEIGIDMLHVPYRGGATSRTDVISGRVDVFFDSLASMLPHIQAGELRAISVMARSRIFTVPDTPTIAEAGFPTLAQESWFGLMAPTGTPSQAILKLNKSLNAALSNPALQASLTNLSYSLPVQPNTPDDLGALIAEETQKWTRIVRERNIKPLH